GEISALPVLDALNRSELPLSNSGKWAALGWDAEVTYKTGQDTTSGWGPVSAYPNVAGAYWTPTAFSDSGGGEAAAITMKAGPELENRYVALWLDMSEPGTRTSGFQSGYQLSWTQNAGSTTVYTVTLSKFGSGVRETLASNASVTISAGSTLAISDTGGTVTAWLGSGGSLSSLLSAADTTYSSGYTGIEAAGNISRSVNFQAGELPGSTPPLLDALNRSETPLSNGGKWSALAWDSGAGNLTGRDTTEGWGPSEAFSNVAGAYWNPTTFSDGGAGDAAAITLKKSPELENRYVSIWLNASSPGTTKSGYQLSWTLSSFLSPTVYSVKLSKWASGTETVLASNSSVTIPNNTTLELTDTGGTVTALKGTPEVMTNLLSAADSTYSNGYAGIEASGNISRSTDFRAGSLPGATEPPAAPTVSGVSPASPANNNSPKISGSAAAGSTVTLYTNSTCTTAAGASGSAATFASPGIATSVADNTTTSFYAKASNSAGSSPCSTSSVTYVEDSTPPGAPTVSSTSPASPANNNEPKVIGSAESGTTVKLYGNSTCTGSVLASGSSTTFASPGITASVADNTTTTFYATATDTAGNASACSTSSVKYEEQTPKVYWGAWMGGNAYGSEYGDAPWDSNTWNKFEEHAGKKVSIVHFGQPAPWNQAFAEGPLKLTRERGAIPLMDMDPDGVTQKEIVEGKKDSYFKTWATAVKNYGYPLFFRWEWEMNGTWFQWGSEAASNPTLYKEVWWHLHKLFEEQGASNITWVWCPNLSFSGSTSLTSLYPGDSYVDWTCLDGYNFGTNPEQPDSWKSFSTLYKTSYEELLSLAPSKPIMIGEMASTEYGGEKSAWITDTYGTQIPKNFPKIKAVVWYNKWDGGRDWPIETTTSAQTAFKNSIASSYYATNSYGNLPKLTKIEPLP
ncbi:MAG: glycosyl hydrolase, partial [Solirubrobacterales bacterium]